MKFKKVLLENIFNDPLDAKRDAGSIFIEFAIKGNKIPTIIRFEGDIMKLMGINQKKYDDLDIAVNDLREKFNKKYGFNKEDTLPKKIHKFIMDEKVFNNMANSIKYYAPRLTNKNKSLTYSKENAKPGEKNPSWDVYIKFRKDVKNGKLIPQIKQNNKQYGSPIGANEVEQYNQQDQ